MSQTRLTPRQLDILSIALLALITLAFFWRVPVQGRVLLPLDVLHTYEPWRSEVPGALGIRLWNPWRSDEVRQFYPVLSFVQASWQQGQIPFWNPHTMTGVPVIAHGYNKVFYPVTVLMFFIMPTAGVISWTIIIHTFLAALFCYLFIRELGSGHFGALVGAIAFALNGYMVLVMPSIARFPGIAWLPLLFWAFERAIRRKTWPWFLLGGMVLWIQILAGHLQVVLYSMTGLGLYALYRSVLEWFDHRNWRNALLPLLFVVIVSLVGLGLSAFQWLPTYELASQAVRGEMQTVATTQEFDEVIPVISPKILLRLVIPDILGTDLDRNIAAGFSHQAYVYFGLMPLIFLIAAAFSTYRRLAWGLIGIGLLVWLVIFKVPPFYELFESFYPSFKVLGFHRAQMLVAFFGAVAAGLGADWVISVRPSTFLKYAVVAGGIVAGIIGSYLLWIVFISKYQSRFFWNLPSVDDFSPVITYTIASLILALIILAATLILLWLWAKGKISAIVFGGVALVFIVIDLFLAHIDYLPALEPDMLYPKTPSLAFMQNLADQEIQPFRIMSVDRLFWGDIASVFGLDDIQGYDSFMTKQYSSYVDLTGARMNTNLRIAAFEAKTSKFIDALNVKYFYIPRYRLADGEWVSLINQVDRPLVESEHAYAGQTDEWIIAGWPQKILLAPTPSKISYRGFLDKPTQIETAIAIDPEVWTMPGIDVSFEVYVQGASEQDKQLLFSERLGQIDQLEQATWVPVVIDLTDFIGQEVVVSFVTTSSNPEKKWDAAWADPLLMDSSKVELLYYGPNSIYVNKNFFPRAWIVHQVTEVAGENMDAVEALLTDPAFDPSQEAVIEGTLAGPASVATDSEYIEFIDNSPTRSIIQVNASAPGLLVVSDIYYPGWEVYVDGIPHELYATNLMMRGVYVPAGKHQVEFVYQPTPLRLGMYISVGTVVIISVVISATLWWRRDKRKVE